MSYLQLVYEVVAAYEVDVNAPLVEVVPVRKSIKYFEESYQADAYHQELVNRGAIAVWQVKAPDGWKTLSHADICDICFALED